MKLLMDFDSLKRQFLEIPLVSRIMSSTLGKYLEVLYDSLLAFRTNQVPVRAAALTYTTLLSLIPFAIILTSFADMFGYLDLLMSFIPELHQSLELNLPMDQINMVIDHVQSLEFGKMGIVGSLTLLASFLIAMSTLEKAMNIIWGVGKNRNWLIRVKLYIPFLIFLLIFILAFAWMLLKFRIYLDHMLEGVTGAAFHSFLPFGGIALGTIPFVWLFLIVLYKLIPFTNVKLRSALVSGTLCTLFLMLFFYLSIRLQTHLFTRYSVVYGSLAILPLLMLFSYILWIIILYGVGLTQAHQQRRL